MRTIIAVNKLSISGAVTKCSNSKVHRNQLSALAERLATRVVTMLTKQYTSDLLETIQGIRHKYVSILAAPKLVKAGQGSVTRLAVLSQKMDITNTSREYTQPRDEADANQRYNDRQHQNWTTLQRTGHLAAWSTRLEVQIAPLTNDGSPSWVVISRRVSRNCRQSARNPCTLASLQCVSGHPERTWRNVHNQIPHLTAIGMTGIFRSISGSGSIFSVETKFWHAVFRIQGKGPFLRHAVPLREH